MATAWNEKSIASKLSWQRKAEQISGLLKDPATVSKWCTNAAQPTIEMLMQISKILDTSLDSLVRFEELPKIGKEL